VGPTPILFLSGGAKKWSRGVNFFLFSKIVIGVVAVYNYVLFFYFFGLTHFFLPYLSLIPTISKSNLLYFSHISLFL